MSSISQCHETGLLFVLARPKSPTFLDEFNEWYNTEHGPLRMRLDFIKNGYRYIARGQGEDTWMGIYDIERVSGLEEPRYTNLRKFRSNRERQIMSKKVDILQRKICRKLASEGSSNGRASVLLTESWMMKEEDMYKMKQRFDVVRPADSSSCAGWCRSRCFEVLDGDVSQTGYVEILMVHELDGVNSPDNFTSTRLHLRDRYLRNTSGAMEIRPSRTFHFYHEFNALDYRQPPEPMTQTRAGPSQTLIPMPVHVESMQREDLDSLSAGRFVPPMVS